MRRTAYFGEGTGGISGEYQCGGSETFLYNCTHEDDLRLSCGHEEDSGVVCEGIKCLHDHFNNIVYAAIKITNVYN